MRRGLFECKCNELTSLLNIHVLNSINQLVEQNDQCRRVGTIHYNIEYHVCSFITVVIHITPKGEEQENLGIIPTYKLISKF